ncbi:cell division control protein 6 homolog [Lineus longissimus]|uniref:cell division control protein 6 homolog n=1 Tax=Lineus longissimus TaxID=88925 RepID=UPI002B4DFD9F
MATINFPARKITRAAGKRLQKSGILADLKSPPVNKSKAILKKPVVAPLSPMKMNLQDNVVALSPRKRSHTFDNKSNTELGVSPSKMRKENFPSPVKQQSPVKHIFNPVVGCPVANRKLDFCSSPSRPVAPPNSPMSAYTTPMTPTLSKLSISGKRILSSPKVTALRLARQDSKCYSDVKKVLHTALPERLLCRDREINEIRAFLDSHVANKKPGSLYISGAPGTGKTAVLSKLIEQQEDKVKTIFINCMSVRNSQDIYSKILCDLCGKEVSGKTVKQLSALLTRKLTSSGPMVTLVLDEMDQLDSKNQEILYSIFEWSALPKSRLVLIGIANSLDLTDRILPRLQSRPGFKPTLLNFTPYTRDQIVAILKDRLENASDVVDQSAVQFCARKVASVAGDMRKALDVCRRAVEKVETDVRSQQVFKTVTFDLTPQTSPVKVVCPKKITIAQVSNIAAEVYSSNAVTSKNQQGAIPLQQKLLICSLLLVMKQGKAKEVSFGKLRSAYCKVCKKRQVEPVDQSECFSLCGLLDSRGIIGLKKAKELILTKIRMRLDEKEVEYALQDKLLISSVLQAGL